MRLFLLFVTLIQLLACKDNARSKTIDKDSLAASVVLVDSQSNFFNRTANLIGLVEPMEKDSFVLRVWVSSMLVDHQVMELRNVSNKWLFRKYDYHYMTDDKLEYKEVPVERISTLKPLVDSLRQIHFSNYISQKDIKGFEDNVADGVTYTIEIFQFSRYKKLTYHCPETYYSKEIHNRKFVDLLMLLDKHFSFYLPMCKKG